MASVNAYINFDGNCAQAFDFYKSVFGGEFQARMKFGEAPGMDVPPELKDKILHVALPIGKNTVLMGSDWSTAQFGPMVRGNSFSLSVQAETQAEEVHADHDEPQRRVDGDVVEPEERENKQERADDREVAVAAGARDELARDDRAAHDAEGHRQQQQDRNVDVEERA